MTVLFLGILQLTLLLHVRNSLIDAASSGARYGALADRSVDDAAERARELVSSSLGDGLQHKVSAVEEPGRGGAVVTVTIRSAFPLFGLMGPGQTLEVTGHAARRR
ncbi:TadE/TadG family type IV pilus assembly protein [Arthrobacter sp. NPDC090010]|uniref:TadE/TadG family type IV pilus assembly protein n=1 Tax=Arthrobacter sp. NPDC090010 TaxID=3363942 RepID=UPI00381B8932